jgi:hypothetical protein
MRFACRAVYVYIIRTRLQFSFSAAADMSHPR